MENQLFQWSIFQQTMFDYRRVKEIMGFLFMTFCGNRMSVLRGYFDEILWDSSLPKPSKYPLIETLPEKVQDTPYSKFLNHTTGILPKKVLGSGYAEYMMALCA